jgi:antitoxin ParD1/3/4
MATMNISLPDKMREWIDQQVATGRFANASDLMRDLIRDAQAKAKAAGIDSGQPKSSPKA